MVEAEVRLMRPQAEEHGTGELRAMEAGCVRR
jgi:hypothetical protein